MNTPDRWQHLNPYERRHLKLAMQAYDEIMIETQDLSAISQHYQFSLEDVERAKIMPLVRGCLNINFLQRFSWARLGGV